ncbi:MAG: hypothetical protein IPM24_04495 [Bryobacterales bacterium]|nr:hypothetical protein [Bryobacterales bacterium]
MARNLRLVHRKKRARAALVGHDTLLGKELREVCSELALPMELVTLAASDEDTGKITQIGDEAAILGRLDAQTLSEARVVFLAGSPESTRRVVSVNTAAKLIDLTYATEGIAGAVLRAPVLEDAPGEGNVAMIAHPAAATLALVLRELHRLAGLKHAVANVFEPVSERGRAAIDEMQSQVLQMLQFKSPPKEIFDAEVAFNILPRYGKDSPFKLEHAEARIVRHLEALLAPSGTPVPSLCLMQAPVFHGHSFSLWFQLERDLEVTRIEEEVTGTHVHVRPADVTPPDMFNVATRMDVTAGAVRRDPREPHAYWMWIVTDNLRMHAQNAVLVARESL